MSLELTGQVGISRPVNPYLIGRVVTQNVIDGLTYDKDLTGRSCIVEMRPRRAARPTALGQGRLTRLGGRSDIGQLVAHETVSRCKPRL